MKIHILSGICAAALCLCISCYNPSGLNISQLRCEELVEPLAIDNTQPHFAWQMESSVHGAAQQAYQILVATVPGLLDEGKADLWDSGRVESTSQVGIAYEGKPLQPRTLVYWKVRVWNQDGVPSSWSKPARFGIGLIGDKDWDEAARFIGIEQPDDELCEAPLLRREFQYTPGKERVLLHVNSLGYHEVYINGRRVSDAMLTPAVSQWAKRSLIVTYDVTALLHKGANDLLLWIGHGWYRDYIEGVAPGGPYVRAQMDAVTPEATRTLLVTNQNWQAASSGRYTYGSWRPHQMGGEMVDERTTVHEFTAKALADFIWEPAVVAQVPAHQATPQMCELTRPQMELHPVEVQRCEDGSYLYDMGNHFVGATEIVMPVIEEGKEITLNYDDIRPKDGEIRDGLYTDIYIGDGKEPGLFASKFNYKGYRYLKIGGLKDAIPFEQITGLALSTDYSGRPRFACSDKDMNRIYEMVRNTLQALTLGGYMVDCPQVERLGYGGDGNASTPTAQALYNLAPLYMNWMQAWADSQRPDGDMPHTAPNPYSAGGGPYWCGFIITASWQTYLNYADSRLLERYYPHMQQWLQFVRQHMTDGLLRPWEFTEYRNWYLGDWATPDGIDQTHPQSVDLVNNCFVSDCLDKMARIAATLGHVEQATAYAHERDSLNARIHATFFQPDSMSYSTGTQIDLAYPMLVGATPQPLRQAVTQTLLQNTYGKYSGHLATGLVGIPTLTQWAIDNGQAQLMYDMLKQRSYPGYLYMIDNGATLTWEHWNGARSHIHNCYNGIGRWFMQALGGICPDDEHPGYTHFYVRPQMPNGITWAEAEKDTPQGRVHVRWERDGQDFSLSVHVPVGSTATVVLPHGAEAIHTDSALPAQGQQVTLPSGHYHIDCTLPAEIQ